MTIRLPNIGEQLAPSMDGIRKLIASIANPNFQQQAALRQALLEGRIQPQELIDLGPEEVERRFGKGTAGFASGKKSLKSRFEDVTAEELQRVMSMPAGTPEREEFLAGRLGIKTSTERTIGEQAVQRNQQIIDTAAQDRARETEFRVLANQAISRIGGKQNLYTAYQNKQLSTQELQAIQGDKEYSEVFNMQRDDYWKQQEMAFREKALNERIDPAKAAKEHNILLARKIVDTTSMSNVQDVNMVLEDRTLEQKYSGKLSDEAIAALSPTEQRVYAAVQAVKMNRTMESDDRRRTAMEYFRKQTSGIAAIFRDQRRMAELGETGIQAQIDLYNQIARQILGPYLEDKDIPELAYDKEGPRGKRKILPDKSTVYQKKGVTAFEDQAVDQATRSGDPVIESYRGKTKQQIDMALSRVDSATAATLRQKLIQAGIYK